MSKLRPISPQPLNPPRPRAIPLTDSRSDERLRLEPLRPIWRPASPKQPLTGRLRTSSPQPFRGLVFDIENRPLSYWYDGNPTAEVTVIAYKWLHEPEPHVLMQNVSTSVRDILEPFRSEYERADVIIGHNVRRHDLPILHGAYIEQGMPGLEPRLTVDTLRDMTRYKDIPKSLEYLAEMLGAPFEKFHMTQHSWRQANRFTRNGLELARQRCAVDVQVNEWVYHELRRRAILTKPPRVWKP